MVLSPDNTFNDRSCNIVFPSISATSFNVTNEEFRHIPDTCSGHSEFNVGVRTVITDDRGHQFKSDFSRAGNSIVTVNMEQPGTITIPESGAVGTVVAVLVVIIILGSGVAYYSWSNRRMRYRFRELIATHYSSATGHATINHHGLLEDDDDESPIIRGFSDNEPLVT